MENTSSVIDTTGTELPQPEDTAPSYITTLEEVVNTHGAIIQQENMDKYSLLSVFQPNPSALKKQLIIWASLGFPDNWKVFTSRINPPSICSDGETREFYPYLLYLLNSPENIYLTNLNSQVPGVSFSFFIGELNTIGLSVFKS
jgi:hypothetical protein